MEYLLLRSKCSIFRHILKDLTLQGRPKVLVWSGELVLGHYALEDKFRF